MKVVLFCGGLGTRLGDVQNRVPKPMVNIGYRPILWHIMKYYAHYGHKDFVLCLGYKADVIKRFFLEYDQCLTSDFTLLNGKRQVNPPQESDIADWRITCIDTGLRSNIGQRLKAVEDQLKGEEFFLANYADGLSDLCLPDMIGALKTSGKVGAFLCVKPSQSFSVVSLAEGGNVEKIEYVRDTELQINGGFFVFRRDVFRYLKDGEELVVEPFQRLIKENQLLGYQYNGFWYCMDTFKEQQELNDMFEQGAAPWEVWKKRGC